MHHRVTVARLFIAPLFVGALFTGEAPAQSAGDPTKLPAVTVTAQKEAQPLQSTPLSVTAVTRSFIEDSGIHLVNDAAVFVPNVYLTEWSARKLSNPRFRGVGSSPNNPGVTTYIDGVPQLNANTSSLELIDVDQIEFVRGPQGALYGRNTVGGLINITSTRPSFDRAQGSLKVGFGDYDQRDARFSISAPLPNRDTGFSLAGGIAQRDGYATNPLTGHDLDSRKASFGKAQLFWRLSKDWETRLILSGERARDGDYRLNDLLAVRRDPKNMPRDFEGFTNRDVLSPTLQINGRTGDIDVALTSGFVRWKTRDVTDLDYSPAPLLERNNREDGRQFTQEVRFSSPKGANNPLTWQAGAFFFTQDYDQDAFNFFPNPTFLRYPTGTPPFRSYTQANLDDHGFGVFGQATFKPMPDLSLSLGLRGDQEKKKALLRTFTVPAGLGAATTQNLSDDFSEVSPHFAASWQVASNQLAYATVARGYKAGGFNAASPAGTERFSKEFSWNYEVGYKASWLDNRLRTNFAAFFARWNDMQLNVPAATPGQFYVANVGAAQSKGVELELTARLAAGWDVFAGGGTLLAKFRNGVRSDGVPVGGNRLPFSPDYTLNGGTQYTVALNKETSVFVRGEANAFGKFYYTDQNVRSQGAYALANFRAGLRLRNWSLEVWMRNAFDQQTVQIAIPYSLAPSGFIGEPGAPRTMGLSAGLRF